MSVFAPIAIVTSRRVIMICSMLNLCFNGLARALSQTGLAFTEQPHLRPGIDLEAVGVRIPAIDPPHARKAKPRRRDCAVASPCATNLDYRLGAAMRVARIVAKPFDEPYNMA